MSIAIAQDIINVIVENDLQQYPIYDTELSDLVLDANEYAIVIHLDGLYNRNRESALYQYPSNWRVLDDKQLNHALRYYYEDFYEPDDIDLPCYPTDDYTIREILESKIVQIHPIIPYSVIEVVPFKIYDLINDLFDEQDERYNY